MNRQVIVVVVGSTNPVKIEATRLGFAQVFPKNTIHVEGINAESKVSNQPKGKTETLKGACNRAKHARALFPQADYWVGVEGGVEETSTRMTEVAYIAVLSKEGILNWSSTTPFVIPPQIADLIRHGEEFGPATDKFFGTSNSKQQNGTIGIISDNLVTRTTLYLPAMVMALLPFKHPEFY